MHESKRECIKYHTQRPKVTNHMLPLDVTLPLDLTYSLPLPLWRQAPKPKGRTVGQEQMSRAPRCGEKFGTMQHHSLTLSSEQSDPLSLEVKVKWSGSTQELMRPVTPEVSL